jgi:1,4-alpha-glucan branching enzyme
MTNQRANGEVEFSFFRPAASRVFVVGDFNGWNTSATPMGRAEGGWWRCRLRLVPGVHQFKYLADGQWYLDYGAFGLERGPLGTWNSVAWVARRPIPEDSAEVEEVVASMEFAEAEGEEEFSLAGAGGQALR